MYFNIPLANHPSLVEAQNYLRRIMGDKVQYTDPNTFHITLLFSENAVDLSEVRFPEHLPLFGLRTDWIDWMRTPENTYAVVLRVDRAPQLIYLQMALYLETIMVGGKVSRFSYPTTYRPHITLGYSSVEPEYMGIVDSPTALEIREVQLTAKDYQAVKSWQLATTVAVQEQMKARPEPLFTLSEQVNSSKAPDIPLPKDIDVEALTQAMGGELVFNTLPIGKVNVESRNKRKYGKQSVVNLVKQVNQLRPEGRWGHLTEEEMGSKYELPAIRWVAAVLDSKGVAWGKALAISEDAKLHFKTAKAMNARVGTSIFGDNPEVDEQGTIVNYRLMTIDLANSERVGIPDTAAVPQLTSEMAGKEENMPQENEKAPTVSEVAVIQQRDALKTENDKLQIEVNNLTPFKDDVSKIREMLALPEKGSVVASVTELSTQVNAIRETFGLDAGVNLATFLRDYHERHLKLAQENTALLGATVKAVVEEQVKIESARGMIIEMVQDRKPITSEQVSEAVKAVLEKPSVKEFLQKQMQSEAGPNVTNPINPRKSDVNSTEQVAIPGQ